MSDRTNKRTSARTLAQSGDRRFVTFTMLIDVDRVEHRGRVLASEPVRMLLAVAIGYEHMVSLPIGQCRQPMKRIVLSNEVSQRTVLESNERLFTADQRKNRVSRIGLDDVVFVEYLPQRAHDA